VIITEIDNLIFESSLPTEILKASDKESYKMILKYLFPKSHKKIAIRYFLDPSEIKKFPISVKDVSFFHNKTSNLKMDIRTWNTSEVNAFTIPGVSDFSKLQKSDNPVAYAFEALKALKNKPLNAKIDGKGKILFTGPKNLKLQMFQTKGLEKLLSQSQRFAVQLHEVGHWVAYEPLIPKQIMSFYSALASIPMKIGFLGTIISVINQNDPGVFRIIWLASLVVVLITVIIANYYSRVGERGADQFVKDIQQGKSLADSLSMFEYNKTVKKSEKERQEDIFDRLGKIIKIPFSTHPSTNDRIKDLLSNEDIGIDSFIYDIFFNKVLPQVRELVSYLDEQIHNQT